MNKIVIENGKKRQMTLEEENEFTKRLSEIGLFDPTPEERIKDLEEALELLLSGVTE